MLRSIEDYELKRSPRKKSFAIRRDRYMVNDKVKHNCSKRNNRDATMTNLRSDRRRKILRRKDPRNRARAQSLAESSEHEGGQGNPVPGGALRRPARETECQFAVTVIIIYMLSFFCS